MEETTSINTNLSEPFTYNDLMKNVVICLGRFNHFNMLVDEFDNPISMTNENGDDINIAKSQDNKKLYELNRSEMRRTFAKNFERNILL